MTCRFCQIFSGNPSTADLCSQCFAAVRSAASYGVEPGRIDAAFVQRWHTQVRRAQRAAVAQWEECVPQQLEALAASDCALDAALREAGALQPAACLVANLLRITAALSSRRYLLTAKQAARIAVAAQRMDQGKLKMLVCEHVIKALHPFVVQQWVMWLDDQRDGCLWHELGRNAEYSGNRIINMTLPCTFQWGPRAVSQAIEDSVAVPLGSICVNTQVKVQNLDPCNFRSVLLRRPLLKERLLAFAMGLHPRLGAGSALQRLADHRAVAAFIASFVSDDGVYDQVKWLQC